MKKFPGEVSGGMKKRAGLARALSMDPEIILFDEPDSGLDPVRVSYLDELIKKIQEETHATFLIITHNIASVLRTSDYIAVLYQTNLVKFAAQEEMRTPDKIGRANVCTPVTNAHLDCRHLLAKKNQE